MSRWDQALAEHEQAIETCIAAARAVPPERWDARGDGWSPSQVLRHVALAYTMVLDDLDGRPPRLRANRRWQFVLRNFWLPILLRTGKFGRVKAPREMRPGEEAIALDDGVDFLRASAAKCRDAMVAARDGRPHLRVTHPYFGPITLLDMLRIGTAHTLHHARKLSG